MFYDYFRWVGEVEEGVGCIGNGMLFFKKGERVVVFRIVAIRERIV